MTADQLTPEQRLAGAPYLGNRGWRFGVPVQTRRAGPDGVELACATAGAARLRTSACKAIGDEGVCGNDSTCARFAARDCGVQEFQ